MWWQSQVHGHSTADLDPVGMFAADFDTAEVPIAQAAATYLCAR